MTVNAEGNEAKLYLSTDEGATFSLMQTNTAQSFTSGYVGFNDPCVDFELDYMWVKEGVVSP